MFCLIGSAPSSGSTLLADLIDSSPISACGPELEVFCNKEIFDLEEFKKNGSWNGSIGNIKSTGTYPNFDRLSSYGLDKDSFTEMLEGSSSIQEFAGRFTTHFLNFREKDTSGVVFEKTPQNINVIEEYLNAFPDGYFIYLVRNPIYVFRSLKKREWTRFFSLSTWLFNVAQVKPYLEHERVIVVKYKDLVREPFEIISSILNKVTDNKFALTPEMIQDHYESNTYRKEHSQKLESWEVSHANAVKNANKTPLADATIEEFQDIVDKKIAPDYAEYYDIEPISFGEAAEALGYLDELEDIAELEEADPSPIKLTFKDRLKLTAKWMREMKRQKKLISPRIFFHPVEQDKEE